MTMDMQARWPEARILVVDDEPSNTRLLVRLLSRHGYSAVRTAADGAAALACFHEFQPDIVLLDLCMPHLDGFELLGLIKQVTQPEALVPVLVISADTSFASKQRARSLGAHDYIAKPYDLQEVLLRVDALLELRAHAQARFRDLTRLQTALDSRVTDQAEIELQTLDGLAAACAYKDRMSEGHTQRVADLAAEIAGELQLPAEFVAAVRRCAPLHDVGKIAIPDEILLKPGSLTPAEMSIAERHTTMGALILSGSRSPLLHLAAEIALAHHERWDGGGYPRGLAGAEIPIAGRIVAVADVYDALTHERPYKEAWSVKRALDEIIASRGSHFDPDVVDALLRLALRAAAAEPKSHAA